MSCHLHHDRAGVRAENAGDPQSPVICFHRDNILPRNGYPIAPIMCMDFGFCKI